MAIIALVILILPVLSCMPPSETGFLVSLDSPCVMEISGGRNGVEFSAELILSGREEDGARSGRLIFTAPAAMEGLEVRTEGGVWGVKFDDVELSGTPARMLGAPMAVFIEKCEVKAAEKADGDKAMTLICAQFEAASAEFLIDSKSGFPISIKEKDLEGNTVMEFEILEYNVTESENKGE